MIDPDISTPDAARLLHTDEPDDRATIDRRRFLQLVGMGVGAGFVAGGAGALLDGLGAGWNHDPSAWAAGPVGPTDGILVVMCMFGGNDGLNTVVPIADGHYYAQHGSLALDPSGVLHLDGASALNPGLTTVKQMWDQGQVAIIEGVGYPKPNLSHFTSMAYWMGAQPFGVPDSGWIGRWLDGYLGGTKDIYAAAEIGQALPLQLRGRARSGTVVPVERPDFGTSYDPVALSMYSALRNANTTAYGPWHAAAAEATADYLDLAAAVAPAYPAAMPKVEPVAKAEAAAHLINANLGFRVLTLSWADFDSHALQPAMHTVRMQELDAAIARFFDVLDPVWRTRVTLMTFSEFGRTSWANAGAGTDHGTSAPYFVIGENVRGGWYGQRPSLAGLGRWQRMAHHVDFRSYFASVVDGWLGGGSSEVLGGTFEDLKLFSRGPGRLPDGSIAPGPVTVSELSGFVPLPPVRIVDTRSGLGAPARKLGPGERIRVQIAGIGGVPVGATAVVANVTAVAATERMYFTVYPGSTTRPGTSSLNGQPGRPVPNLVVMRVGLDGCIEVFNSHGDTHCLVDVFGYAVAGAGDGLVATPPHRLFDTRVGSGIAAGKLGGQQPVDVQVAGRAGVPLSGATAVVMNLTAARPDSTGWLRLTPTGRPRAETSNVNFFAGDVVPNLVICQLGDGGKVTLDADGAGVDVVGDVFGYFAADGGRLRAMPPRRVLDTRDGTGAAQTPIGPGRTVRLQLGGVHGIPSTAVAVVLNLAATKVEARSYVSVWPDGEADPGTSNLNVAPGRISANLVICRLGATGAVQIANPVANCDVIGDVAGYFV